jgi:sugar lactone lactonase YvrE
MKTVTLALCIFLLSASFTFAQVVETVSTHSEIRDGLHTDSLGNVYVASGGASGFTICKYNNQNNQFDPQYISGFQGPVDVDVYQDSLYIVTNYDDNTAVSYNMNTGAHTVIASGLDGPSGIVIDSADNIYVASWGAWPNYSGHQIHRIDASGSVSNYIDTSALYRPQAMTINQAGLLVVFAQQNLYTVNPVDSSLQLWTNVGMKLGHLIFRQQDSCIYGTAIDLHKIIKVDVNGNVTTIAGTTVGYEDGPGNLAKFRNPLGIELSPDEDTLYVSEAGYSTSTGRLRRVILNQTVGVPEYELNNVTLYPNPTSGCFKIENSDNEYIQIELFDHTGKLMTSEAGNAVQVSMDISNYARGSYFVKITRNHQVIMKRLIKL